ncbi:hypothetical protein IWX90DRAFT_71606 [Phyllosticta citrichinensis]|uniref:Uncharacterized protein n=1 Tax=Phyllosticta citrichinensis TaxID=1130410 RepID=A0ABR1XGF9_9PEZI
MPSHPVCARLRRPPAELAILARKQRYSLTLVASCHLVYVASQHIQQAKIVPIRRRRASLCATGSTSALLTSHILAMPQILPLLVNWACNTYGLAIVPFSVALVLSALCTTRLSAPV